MLVTILCDNCGWEKDKQVVKKWVGKKCPRCCTIIVNGGDLWTHKAWVIGKLISDILCFFFPKVEKKSIEVDSIDSHFAVEEAKKLKKRQN